MRNETRIGSGAGFAGDRIDAAVELVRDGALDDLVLECLAERTIALAQGRRHADSSLGYDLYAAERFRALLPVAIPRGVRILSNLGAANPVAAGRLAVRVAEENGLECRVAVVTGDDVLDLIDREAPALEDGKPLSSHGEIISANAYLGADALLPGLRAGADVIITGRVADPSLFVAALVDRLGWDLADESLIAAATLAGHLLECGAQVTGGYFADPGYKTVPGLESLGLPFADIRHDGSMTIGKVNGTGGMIDRRTVREQLLYELGDPGAYKTPDVTLDVYGVTLREVAPDRVQVSGAVGRRRPDELKVSVGYRAGFRSEGEISYAGLGCVDRARLAGEIAAQRIRRRGVEPRIDLIGTLDTPNSTPDGECRLRVAAMTDTVDHARDITREVEALYLNGPAGGGGVRTTVTEVIGILSTFIDRTAVTSHTEILEAK
ncbi:ABC transporter substrate-binding protein [Mycobacterium sp. SWH-M5]|nr:ABC transporter substrate-binding protein [Mycobacterium sp. SWH-M5]